MHYGKSEQLVTPSGQSYNQPVSPQAGDYSGQQVAAPATQSYGYSESAEYPVGGGGDSVMAQSDSSSTQVTDSAEYLREEKTRPSPSRNYSESEMDEIADGYSNYGYDAEQQEIQVSCHGYSYYGYDAK